MQIAKEKGVKIPVQHMAIVNEERKLNHGVTQYYGIGPGDGTWETKDQGFYVESLTTANQATGLVSSENAGIFSVNYKQKINANYRLHFQLVFPCTQMLSEQKTHPPAKPVVVI